MKETPHITLTEEQDKRETIRCAMWASVVVLYGLALLIGALAYMSYKDFTPMAEMQKRITAVEWETQWLTNEVVSGYSDLMDAGPIDTTMVTVHINGKEVSIPSKESSKEMRALVILESFKVVAVILLMISCSIIAWLLWRRSGGYGSFLSW